MVVNIGVVEPPAELGDRWDEWDRWDGFLHLYIPTPGLMPYGYILSFGVFSSQEPSHPSHPSRTGPGGLETAI